MTDGLSDEILLRAAIRYVATPDLPLWTRVCVLFDVTPSTARHICIRFGYNPDIYGLGQE